MNLSQEILCLYERQEAEVWHKIPFYKVEIFWKIGQLLFINFWEIINESAIYKQSLKAMTKKTKSLPEVADLYKMTQFYLAFPHFNQLSPLLSWSHYQLLVKLNNTDQRNYYHRESIQEKWTLRELQRAINNQQFQRIKPLMGSNQMTAVTHSRTYFQFSFLKKFIGKTIPERVLEEALVEQLQAFLGELGKGFAFVARQKRLITPNGKQMFVDLLFYNYLLNRFVLIDLKVVPLAYQHIGQMDTYCRLFEDTSPIPDKSPCMSIILCPEIDTSLLYYSLLKDNPSIFAFEYTLDPIDANLHEKREQLKRWEKTLFERTNN